MRKASAEPSLPLSPTCHDLLAARPLPDWGRGGKGIPQGGLGTRSVGVGARRTERGEGSPRTSLTPVILPFLVYRESVGREWSPRPADTLSLAQFPESLGPHEGLKQLMESDWQSQGGTSEMVSSNKWET